jgi:hypothetical protein
MLLSISKRERSIQVREGNKLEYEDPPEHIEDDFRNSPRWVLGLSCGDGDGFGAAV